MVWLLFASCHAMGGMRFDIGKIPWTLEGTPRVHRDRLLIPFDGGITTVQGESERMVFP